MAYRLSAQKVRDDLLWALTSPNMMALNHNMTAIPSAGELGRWIDSDGHPARLIEHLEQRAPKRLGIYFEVLWHYFLEQHPGFDLISRNLPVRSNGQTLGEFDFIYFCRQRQRFIHLETAVKFYLGMPGDQDTPSAWEHWIGPGSKDRLDLKLNKMIDKQTQLSRTPEGAELMQDLGATDLISEVCLKGYFFYPLSTGCPVPRESGNDHLRGYWLRLGALEQLAGDGLWAVLQKQEWLAPGVNLDPEELLNFSRLQEKLNSYFADNRFPLMLVSVQEQDNRYDEQARYFVTNDSWPD